MASRLRIIARKNRAFDMHLAAIGAFPGFTAPRVLWVGIDSGVENCASLASQVKESLCALGVKSEERDFAPHITLGRVRSSKNIGVLMKILEKERQFSSQEKILIDRMILFQSKLSQQGPTYRPLEEFPLQ